MPTKPTQKGTIVAVTTRYQKYYTKIYETPRKAEAMLTEEGAFNCLVDLGTIKGDEVGQVGQL